jgi:hypothetical protein
VKILRVDSTLPKNGEIWHPYWILEEFKTNMWGNVTNRKNWLEKAIEFTSNHELYGSWMIKVTEQWPRSCEHNLSKGGDKRAWIGHAAVALAIDCTESIVREAWGHLTPVQQELANKQAEIAIEKWRNNAKT